MTAEPYDLLVKNGSVAFPDGTQETSIALKEGRFAEIGEIDESRAKQVLDAKGLTVLPGVIDTQVHFREPGNEHKEDLQSARWPPLWAA